MKKRIFALILTLTICLSLGSPALATGMFYDVDENAWYVKYLDTAASSGLIDGRGDGSFAPNDYITGAEALKIAACLGQLLSEGSVNLTNGSPWYESYMDYAIENGIIDSELDKYLLDDYIMRSTVMDMICRAIPETQRSKINSIPEGSIPDIVPNDPYRDNIYTLYSMGIVTGSDERGSCLPEKPISRAEVATLVARVIDKNLRVLFHLDASDPLDFTNESDLRAVLEGEWEYCPPNSDIPAAWIAFSMDGNLYMRVMDSKNNAIWENVGFYELERWYVEANEAPDVLMLTFSDTVDYQPSSSAGDYMIMQKTLCDGEIMLRLMQVNNGDSMISACFDDWAPILKRYTNWQPQEFKRVEETFYAAVWKVDDRLVWLDDAASDGNNIGRHEALPYMMAPQLNLSSVPDWLLGNGAIWNIQTDAMGQIKEMYPFIYEN